MSCTELMQIILPRAHETLLSKPWRLKQRTASGAEELAREIRRSDQLLGFSVPALAYGQLSSERAACSLPVFWSTCKNRSCSVLAERLSHPT